MVGDATASCVNQRTEWQWSIKVGAWAFPLEQFLSLLSFHTTCQHWSFLSVVKPIQLRLQEQGHPRVWQNTTWEYESHNYALKSGLAEGESKTWDNCPVGLWSGAGFPCRTIESEKHTALSTGIAQVITCAVDDASQRSKYRTEYPSINSSQQVLCLRYRLYDMAKNSSLRRFECLERRIESQAISHAQT